jgi:uncharacterized membrane protein YfcA
VTATVRRVSLLEMLAVAGAGVVAGAVNAIVGSGSLVPILILLAVLRLAFADDLQRLNAVKNVLAGVANAVAAVLFIAVADVAWEAAALIAAGSIVGAAVGASYGRRLPEVWLRRIVIVGGTIVALILIFD